MRPVWKKLGRALETIVVVALVLAVAMLWDRDPVEVVRPVVVTATEPVVVERGPQLDTADHQIVRASRDTPVSVEAMPTPSPITTASVPTREPYRPDYDFVVQTRPPVVDVECGEFDLPATDEFLNAGYQPEVTLRLATMVPENSQWMRRMRAAGKNIAFRTGGRVSIKFYGGGSQGSEDRVMQKIQIGQLHGGTFSPSDFQQIYPDLYIYGLPLLFDSEAELRLVRERLDEYLLGGLRETGFVSFGFVGSFAHLMSNQSVDHLAALSGSRIWVPEGDGTLQSWIRVNFIPVPLPVADVYTALQIGLIDHAILPPEVAVALQWHTKTRFVLDRPFHYAMSFLAISRRAFEKLGFADRTVIQDEFGRAYCEFDAQSKAETIWAFDALRKIGISTLTLPQSDWDELHRSAYAFRQQLVESGGISAQLYDEVTRLLDESRSQLPY